MKEGKIATLRNLVRPRLQKSAEKIWRHFEGRRPAPRDSKKKIILQYSRLWKVSKTDQFPKKITLQEIAEKVPKNL
jgi:hypothetical protein